MQSVELNDFFYFDPAAPRMLERDLLLPEPRPEE